MDLDPLSLASMFPMAEVIGKVLFTAPIGAPHLTRWMI
jgi:hypothetical protein